MSKDRKSILSSVNNWIRLLALIVLVAEVIILVAMKLTPPTSPLYNWYPVFMLLFLLVIVIAVIVDRFGQRNSLVLEIDEQKLKVNPKKNKIDSMDNLESNTNSFIDSHLKFSFHKPILKSNVKLNRVSYGELLIKIGVAAPDNEDEIIRAVQMVNPFGKMITNSNNIDIQIGDKYEIQFNNESSLSRIERYINNVVQIAKDNNEELPTDEEISNLRANLMYGDLDIYALNYFNGCIIQVFNKEDAKETMIPPTLPNIFSSLQSTIKEPLESLVSNEDSILWGTTNHYLKVLINGVKKDFSIYRMYQLIENKDFVYLIQLQWSPQTNEAINTWEELKKLLENFKVTTN
ncbi:hypothetical protein [Hyunsoonleella ulvae]|uniref:hypothetical protein n=1 Tax=Hyunsoonleella ulvae TaxID=2799948 RepID=UPI00193A59D9|nr:hypothetical protein [Hyunsoonleella ulvae]